MRYAIFSVAALLVTSTAASASDFWSPRTAALGGAGHAAPMLNDAIYLNPSFVSFLPSYSLAMNYLYYQGPSTDAPGAGDPHGHGVNLSLQDGRSELFQAGAALTVLEDRKIINFGASKSIVKRFGLGAGGKFLLPNTSAPHPIWDSIFSMTGVPADWVQVSGILDNILESQDGLQYGLFREYILGTKFNVMSIVLIYFDPHWAPHAPDIFGLEFGLEFPIMTDFFLRLGHFGQSNVPFLFTRGNGYTAGLGWISPRISFDYAFVRMIDPFPTTAHNFGMTIYF